MRRAPYCRGVGDEQTKPDFDVSVQFGLVFDELAHRRGSQDRRLGAAETVSGIVVATSAVVVSVAVVDLRWSLWLLVALIPAAAAAGFGVAALWPSKIEELDPVQVRGSVLSRRDVDAQLWLADQQIFHIESREVLIRRRFELVRAGLVCLIVSVVGIILVAALTTTGAVDDEREREPGHQRSQVASAGEER